MENEQILSALTKLLEGQKETQKMNEKLNLFLAKMNSENGLVKNERPELKQLQEDILKIQNQLSDMPKNVIQQKRYLLFPEYYAKEYYGVVLKWMLYMLIATYACYLLRILMESLR
jgi:hypothetical protein